MVGIKTRRAWGWLSITAAAFTLAAATGCSDGGTGGAGGAGAGGAGTGGVGTGGAGTGGAGTGGAASCVDAAAFASLFTIADSSFCAVAVYEAPESLAVPSMPFVVQAPSWGAHGGPVWFQPDAAGGGVTIERWTAPAGPQGMLTKQSTHVDTMIPAGAFAGAQAVDVPFFGWTAISWTGAFPDTVGQVIMIKGSAVARTFAINGAFALAGVGDATSGRLLSTSLSPVGAPMTDKNGLYAADACDMPKPDLGAGTGCEAPAEVASWGDSSGPITVDHDGNAFVVLASFGMGTQDARGFAAKDVARGAAPTEGTTLFTLPGFGSSAAAITPRDGKPGLLVFQPFDTGAAPLDVIAQAYTAGSAVTAQGAPTKLLAMPATGAASLFLMTDAADRLWVAASHDTTTTFVVIDRRP